MEKYIELDLLGYGSQGSSVVKVKNIISDKIFAMKKILIDTKKISNYNKNIKNKVKVSRELQENRNINFNDNLDIENVFNKENLEKQINEVSIFFKQ